MDIQRTRPIHRGNIYYARKPETAKLRVAAYARVSSDSADQFNSYMAQVDFYTKFISSREDWELVDIYADEGTTGTSMKKRKEFLKMLQDCDRCKIDLVITKSVSRFGRNTLDGLPEVDPDEAAIVRRIFSRYLLGQSVRQI